MPIRKEKAVSLLEKSITKTGEVYSSSSMYLSPNFVGWERSTRLSISHVFGDNSRHIEEFNKIDFSKDVRGGYLTARVLLESMLEEIRDYWPEDPASPPLQPSISKNSRPSERFVKGCVFIGHGRSKLWARLKIFLQEDLDLDTITYESESHVGESIIPILEAMLDRATFAIVVLTAEDETSAGTKRARQNVIHEAGLFQGRLGFRRAVVIRQEGLEDFTNVAGLQYIGFSGDRIEDTFYELQRVLRREGVLS
ncbi:MAG TPA: nucleotide-binding protein [Pyrinomonadaceae bacterium]|nr:nucleotide-binding protein [Pyrinomonadaceae bacterium]